MICGYFLYLSVVFQLVGHGCCQVLALFLLEGTWNKPRHSAAWGFWHAESECLRFLFYIHNGRGLAVSEP